MCRACRCHSSRDLTISCLFTPLSHLAMRKRTSKGNGSTRSQCLQGGLLVLAAFFLWHYISLTNGSGGRSNGRILAPPPRVATPRGDGLSGRILAPTAHFAARRDPNASLRVSLTPSQNRFRPSLRVPMITITRTTAAFHLSRPPPRGAAALMN